MSQAELIKRMSGKEVRFHLLLTQFLFFITSLLLSFFLFPTFSHWTTLFTINIHDIVLYGVVTALFVVVVELLLYVFLPKHLIDDGGINEKVFTSQSVPSIILITFVVSISEEFLFRGVLQTSFGLFIASSLFVLMHVRYLKKPVLLILTILLSFLIGYLFDRTGSLPVVIVLHFLVNLLLGLFIKFKK